MIESPRNPHIKRLRRARRGKDDCALLEGPHLVSEALAAGLELDTVLATPEFLAGSGADLARQLPRAPLEVAPGLLAEVTDADSPRGILALARLPRRGCEELPRRGDGIYLYVAGIQDPGNLGAVARVAEAAGAVALAIAPGSVHPDHPRALRGSAGSLLRLPVAVDVDPARLDDHLAAIDPVWVALSPRGGTSIYDPVPPPPLILAIGAERGLPRRVERHCDHRLHVPMEGPVESLNTAVATAVALFEIRRQHDAGAPAAPPPARR